MILETTCRHRQPLHDEIQRQIDAYVDSGRMIEILAPGESSGARLYFNDRVPENFRENE